ncbi:MAG: hypothetical protein WCB49_11185 [Gammaproteobacteria bacterium]
MIEAPLASRYDKIFRSIQDRVADQLQSPVEIQLWGERSYRLGQGEPRITILVNNRDGLRALSGLDELRICEAYMAGNLDVTGDMLGFAGLRGALSDNHPYGHAVATDCTRFPGSGADRP